MLDLESIKSIDGGGKPWGWAKLRWTEGQLRFKT